MFACVCARRPVSPPLLCLRQMAHRVVLAVLHPPLLTVMVGDVVHSPHGRVGKRTADYQVFAL